MTPPEGSGKGTDRIPFNNPGWAGNTGDFELTEAQVRGEDFVGRRAPGGGHAAGAPSYAFMLPEKHPEAPLFEGPYRERYEKILSRYPGTQPALLPVLNLAQEIRGHVSPETMDEVAGMLDLPKAYVRGVATFYTMYNKAPVGRYLVQVCTNISCNLCGADEVLAAFLEHTGTELGETSEDGMFTTIEVECLAACGFPTCVQINSRYFEDVEAEDVPAILERLRGEARSDERQVSAGAAGRPGGSTEATGAAGATGAAEAGGGRGSPATPESTAGTGGSTGAVEPPPTDRARGDGPSEAEEGEGG